VCQPVPAIPFALLHYAFVLLTSLVPSTQSSVTDADFTGIGSRSAYVVVFLVVIGLLILPIWAVSVVPWADYGDHMARIFIERHYDTVPIFRQYYQISYLLFPNLAVDLVGVALLHLFDPDTTAHLIASLSVVIFALGCHLFGKAVHGAPTWLAIPAAFFFYNSLLIDGFVNYMWSVALFLITAAAWMRFVQKPGLLGGFAVAMLSLATYTAHLAGFFFLCSFVGLYVAVQVLQGRRITLADVWALATLLPGLLAYWVFRQTEKAIVSNVEWSSGREKLRHAWVLFAGYSTWMDLMVAAGLAATVILTWWYVNKVSIRLPLLIISASYLAAFICFPTYFHTGSDADTRFFPVAALVALLSVTFRLPRFPAYLVYSLLLTISVSRIGAMTFYWHQADRFSREQRALLYGIAENSRIYPLVFLPPERTASKIRQHLTHLAGYSTVDRHAISGSTFTVPGQQPLQRRIPMWFGATGRGATVQSFKWEEIFAEYDYVWAYGAPPPILEFLGKNYDFVAQTGEGRLYRIRTRQPL
jgi:hypothetical protein